MLSQYLTLWIGTDFIMVLGKQQQGNAYGKSFSPWRGYMKEYFHLLQRTSYLKIKKSPNTMYLDSLELENRMYLVGKEAVKSTLCVIPRGREAGTTTPEFLKRPLETGELILIL